MTEASFNPYSEWLGLDPNIRQPNYYQICGLSADVTDRDEIHAAVEHAVVKVRGFRPGPRAREWAQLLDDLAAAKATLLDPEKRAKYDQSLAASGTSDTAAKSASTTAVDAPVEVAAVNRDPNLFPPGMAPAGESTAKRKAPAKPKKATKRRAKSATTNASDDAPTAASPTPRKSKTPAAKRAKKAATSARRQASADRPTGKRVAATQSKGVGRKLSQSRAPQPAGSSSASKSSDVNADQVAEPEPVNAHVAPPPNPRASIWPVAAAIGAAVVLITLAILYVALYAGN